MQAVFMADGVSSRAQADQEDLENRNAGRPSVLPEMLLKALLQQILFTIRSERLLVEAITYNLVRIGRLGGWWDAHHA